MIKTICPSCSSALAIPAELLGRKVACSKCKTIFAAEDGSAAVAVVETVVVPTQPEPVSPMQSALAKLVQAIRKVVRGGKYVSATLAEKLVYDLDSNSVRAPHEVLSDREYQVLCMIASGKTVTMIAEELVLSVKTISTYRVRILEKLNMKNNAELTRYAIKEGLVD